MRNQRRWLIQWLDEISISTLNKGIYADVTRKRARVYDIYTKAFFVTGPFFVRGRVRGGGQFGRVPNLRISACFLRWSVVVVGTIALTPNKGTALPTCRGVQTSVSKFGEFKNCEKENTTRRHTFIPRRIKSQLRSVIYFVICSLLV